MSVPATSALRSATAPPGSAIGSDGRVLTRGFYQLTLVAVFLTAAAEIGVRALPGLPTLSLLELVVIPAALCLIVEILCRPRLRALSRACYRRNRPVVWYSGYAALASLAGLGRSLDTLRSFHELAIAGALYVLVCLTVDDEARMRRLLAAALAGAMVNVGLAVLQIGAGGPYIVPVSENIDAKLDLAGNVAGHLVTGLFNHPNGLAVFLLPVVLFLLAAAWAGFHTARRRGPLMAALLALALLVLARTYAKGAYAWLAAGGLALVLPRRFDRHRAWLAMAVAVAGVATLTWVSLDAFLEGDPALATIVSRIELWGATLDILQSDSFVAGFGGGGSQLAGRTIAFEYTNAHNAWLDQTLTYGVPALVFYLGAYLTAFRSLARRIRSESHPTRTLAIATYASLLAILGESFFEPTNHSIAFQAQLFLLFAIAGASPGSISPR